MRERSAASGYSLLEMIVVTAMVSTIALSFILFSSKISMVMKRFQVRQQIQMDTRSCVDTITQRMRTGKARSLIISTPNVVPMVPNSRADFDLQSPLPSGATSYAIFLIRNVVYAQELGGPVAVRPPKSIASRVGSLMFTGDSRDPAIVRVSVRFAAPWDQSNDPAKVSVFDLSQEVHMVDVQ